MKQNKNYNQENIDRNLIALKKPYLINRYCLLHIHNLTFILYVLLQYPEKLF